MASCSALVLGAGPVGHAHARLLHDLGLAVAVVDPVNADGSIEQVVHQELRRLQPQLVVVAVPPLAALPLARAAARSGATVVLEKPGVLAPLQPAAEDERIYLAHEAHQHPTAVRWLAAPPAILHAEVQLQCWRPAEHYRGWRAHRAIGGGLLYQQAHQSLALLLRVVPDLAHAARLDDVHTEGTNDVERAFQAHLTTPGGPSATVQLRADDRAAAGRPQHTLRLHTPTGPVCLTDPLAAGVAHPQRRWLQRACRARLHNAVLASADGSEPPGLHPLGKVRPLQDLITRLYRAAGATVVEEPAG